MADERKNNKPMYRLNIVSKNKEGRQYTNAGVLFESQLGMRLILNPGIVLTHELQKEHYLNIMPYDSDKRDYLPQEKPATGGSSADVGIGDTGGDDDIPF